MPSPPAAASPAVSTPHVRVLSPEEYPRLASYEPFATHGLPDPTHWRVVVAEADSQIIGFVCLFEAVHMEPFWLDPRYRHHAKLFTDLWRETRTLLDQAGVETVFATIDDATVRASGQFLEHLGFRPSPGYLYILHVPDMPLGA
jgi:hypothetical protein